MALPRPIVIQRHFLKFRELHTIFEGVQQYYISTTRRWFVWFFLRPPDAPRRTGTKVSPVVFLKGRVPRLNNKLTPWGSLVGPPLPPLPFDNGPLFRGGVLHILRRPLIGRHGRPGLDQRL